MRVAQWNSCRPMVASFVLLLLLQLLVASVARASSVSKVSCDGVADLFAKKVGTSHIVPALPVTGELLSICTAATKKNHRHLCCTENMESDFVAVSQDYVHKMLETSSGELTNSIKRSLNTFLEHMNLSMTNAFDSTSQSLVRLFQIPREVNQPVLRKLFDHFNAFIGGSNIYVEDIIYDFFVRLFPTVYHYVLSRPSGTSGQSGNPGSEEFNRCLMESYDEIRPFDSAPEAFTKRVHFALERVQAVENTLRVMLNTTRTVESLDIDSNCRRTFARLHFCPMCAGQTRARPCRGFCLNVVRGCLPNIRDISSAWDNLVDVFRGTLRRNNLQEALAYFNGNVSEAVMIAMTESSRIFSEVGVRCQEFASSSQEDRDPLEHPSDTAEPITMFPSPPTGPVVSLYNDLLKFGKKLDNSKGYLARLADGLCRREDLFDQEMRSSTCWNGTMIGRYTRGVPEADILTQAQNNQEVRVSLYPKPSLLDAEDRMRKMKKTLSFLSKQELMVGDQSYGSGDYYDYEEDPITDDEDFSDRFSGSGSGFRPIESVIDSKEGTEGNGRTTPTGKKKPVVIDNNTGDDRWDNKKPEKNKYGDGNGGLPVSSASLVSILCCCLVWLQLVAMSTTSS